MVMKVAVRMLMAIKKNVPLYGDCEMRKILKNDFQIFLSKTFLSHFSIEISRFSSA